jgi:hypothetical protein
MLHITAPMSEIEHIVAELARVRVREETAA